MKSILYLCLIVLGGLLLNACKKDISPTLVVTVVDSTGQPFENVTVITHPCYDKNAPCRFDDFNEDYIQEKTSNSAGQATFYFEHNAVLDVIGKYIVAVGDTLEDRTVVFVKKKKLSKGDKNVNRNKIIHESQIDLTTSFIRFQSINEIKMTP